MRIKPWGRDLEWSVIQAPAQSRVSSAVTLPYSGLAESLKSPRTESSQTCLGLNLTGWLPSQGKHFSTYPIRAPSFDFYNKYCYE